MARERERERERDVIYMSYMQLCWRSSLKTDLKGVGWGGGGGGNQGGGWGGGGQCTADSVSHIDLLIQFHT